MGIGKALKAVVSLHRQSAALMFSLIGACKALEMAWNRIHAWLEAYGSCQSQKDSVFFEQLQSSIDAGKIVLECLQQDLEPYTHIGCNAAWKTIFKESEFKDHCTRLNLHVSSLHLLLATANLYVCYLILSIGLLIVSRPQPKARNLVCDCLRPVFRKDEESAWTIVATRAGSSRVSFNSVPRTVEDETDSIWSDRPFSFTDDLLTAPVYKRLLLSMLNSPRQSKNVDTATCSASVKSASNRQTLSSTSQPDSTHESCITFKDRRSLASTVIPTNTMNATDGDQMQVAAEAAREPSAQVSSPT